MNRNFIFVFILLAVLSMVNAIPLQKRETKFGKCPPISGLPTQPEQISGSISPDPIVPGQDVTFTFSGTLSKEITSDHKLYIEVDDLTAKEGLVNFLEPIPPTKAKTPFKVVVSEPMPIQLSLAKSYVVWVAIEKFSDPPDFIGCASVTVG